MSLICTQDRNEPVVARVRFYMKSNHDTSMVMQRFPEQNAQLHIGTARIMQNKEPGYTDVQ